MELFAPLDTEEVDKLGGYLNIPQSEIDRIQKDYQSPTQRKEACLDLYVHQHPCPTWNQVAMILHFGVNLRQQADLVENTYVKGTQDTLLYYNICNDQHCMCYNRKPCILLYIPNISNQFCVFNDTADMAI